MPPSAVLATRSADQRRAALGGEAQRVVFQGLVGDPLVVVAPYPHDPLSRCH